MTVTGCTRFLQGLVLQRYLIYFEAANKDSEFEGLPMETELGRYAKAIADAREDVKKASVAYSKGGSVKAINEANAALADAHQAYYACAGGQIPENK